MPVYKYKLKDGSERYFAKFYYENLQGERKQAFKRGFESKKDAEVYEANFLAELMDKPNVSFRALVESYLTNCKNKELKATTLANKEYLISKHILPFFEDMAVGDIDAGIIAGWQKSFLESGEEYAPTYIYNINNLLKYMFDFAVEVYGLSDNPVRKCSSIGKARNEHMDYWTVDEFKLFINALQDTAGNRSAGINRKADKNTLVLAFNILFFCGLRVGELLALTKNDIDFDNSRLSVSKTYKKLNGSDLVTSLARQGDCRSVKMVEHVRLMFAEYVEKLSPADKDQRIFSSINYSNLSRAIRSEAKLAGIKEIRVQDLSCSCARILAARELDLEQIRKYLD